MLASWTCTPCGGDLYIILVQDEATRFWVKDGYRNGRRLDSPTLLGRRDTLKPMTPSFVLKEPLGSLALEQDGNETRTVL